VKPESLPELVEALDRHGYDEASILGILGENFLRVASQNWRPAPSTPTRSEK